jgi:hypothetical protein
LESNLIAHKFKQKVLNFCENSHMVNHSNFWDVTGGAMASPDGGRATPGFIAAHASHVKEDA